MNSHRVVNIGSVAVKGSILHKYGTCMQMAHSGARKSLENKVNKTFKLCALLYHSVF